MLLLRILVLLACCLRLAAEESVRLGLGPHRGMERSSASDGGAVFRIDGSSDAHFWSAPLTDETTLDSTQRIGFDYFSLGGIESITVRYRNAVGEMIPVGTASLPSVQTWQPFSVDVAFAAENDPSGEEERRFHFSLKGKAGDEFRLRHLRLRPPTPGELEERRDRDRKLAVREEDSRQFLHYIRDWYPDEICEVIVEAEEIVVRGRAMTGTRLDELPPHRSSHHASANPGANPALDGGAFEKRIPRFARNGRDRAMSRWRVIDGESGAPRSHAKWATGIAEGIARDLPELSADSIKGIGGVPAIGGPEHPIFELGVSHATVNLLIDAGLATTQRRGFEPFVHEGRTYFQNPAYFAGIDRTVRTLTGRGVIVSGILLVGNAATHSYRHPEAEPRGTYSMPNLTSPEATAAYRAAIHFLTERYSRVDGEHGRIANWILHNEVDQARTWTNMGEQPLPRFLEHLHRSGRIVHHTARLHDPHARVFLSLTHHWAKPSLGPGAYTVRELLDLWAEIGDAEGDFEWGVAYHPYPQNLRNPDAWADEAPAFDYDTPYITPKNIAVLPAYLSRPEMRYRDEHPRAILLSEQGFSTPTLDEVDQKRQVAALVYAFRRMEGLPQIEAYHYHRYQDMPDGEGGLRFGLLDENGNRKLGWDAYAAIGTGTEAEEKTAALADELLPTNDPAPALPERTLPNLVLMMADDLGWSDTTPYLREGEDFYETPNLARLAARGVRYTNAYAANPLCSPTRASILTGQYPGRLRLTTPACHLPGVVLDPKVAETGASHRRLLDVGTRTRFPNFYVTVAERLKEAGYGTAFVGKWHLGREPYFPDQQGFDLVVGGREHPGPPGGFFAPWTCDTLPEVAPGTHIGDAITAASVRWMEERSGLGDPFFLNLWFYSVHAPFEAKPELVEKYRAKAADLPADAPRRNPVMAAMIETLDDNVGLVLDTIDRLGIAEETLVVFTSDNGGNEYNLTAGLPPTNNAPLSFGKGNAAEGGVRVPFLASWPGRIPEGETRTGLVSSVDLYPTLLAAAEQTPAPEQVVDGIDLLPDLLGQESIPEDRAIFCHFPHAPGATGAVEACTVRRGNWKLTRFFADAPAGGDRLWLANLAEDPAEAENRAEAKPELAVELDALISRHLADTEALVPLPNPAYEPTFRGWTAGGDASLTRSVGMLLVRSNGKDPWLVTSSYGGAAKGSLSVEVEFGTGALEENPSLYWSTREKKGFGPDRLAKMVSDRPGLYRVDLDLGGETLHALRLDPSRRPGETAIRTIRLIEWKTEGEGKTVRLWTF